MAIGSFFILDRAKRKIGAAEIDRTIEDAAPLGESPAREIPQVGVGELGGVI